LYCGDYFVLCSCDDVIIYGCMMNVRLLVGVGSIFMWCSCLVVLNVSDVGSLICCMLESCLIFCCFSDFLYFMVSELLSFVVMVIVMVLVRLFRW